jgi:hypothetical protein
MKIVFRDLIVVAVRDCVWQSGAAQYQVPRLWLTPRVKMLLEEEVTYRTSLKGGDVAQSSH